MNLQNKKARIPIAALGVTALIAAAGVIATPAFASPAGLTLNSGGASQAVGNFGSATVAAANAAYALKITDATSGQNATLKVVSAPTGGSLGYQKDATNGAATTGFSTVTVAPVTTEVQAVTITGTPTGGTFTLSFGGQTTAGIAYNATAATVQTALQGLSSIGSGNAMVTGGPGPGTAYAVTFGGTFAGTNVAQMTTSGASLTGGTSPASAVSTTTQGGVDPSVGVLSPVVNTDDVYVTGDVPGTYTYRLFEDTNANGVYDSADERSTDLITLKVYDVGGPGTTASDTTDDVAPVIAAATPGAIGQPIVATVTYTKALSMTDARGSGVTTGIAGRLAALTFFDVTAGGTGVSAATDQPATYSTSTLATTYAAGTPSALGTAVLRADLKLTSGTADTTTTSFGSKSIVVNDNHVATMTIAPTLVDGKVIATGGAVTVKSGTAAVTYAATALTSGAVPVAGATVNFTVAGTAPNVALLSTDGTAVDTSSTTSKVYSAITNASGVASLTVTSSSPVAAGVYTVAAATNGVTGTPAITTTYADPAAAAIATTSSAADLTPAITATSVTLKGKLTDQFGAAYAPASSASQQVGVQIPDLTGAGFATIGSDGTFSYVYTPATAPAAGDSVTFDWTYGTLSDGATTGGTIRWASTTAASTVTISAPADAATGIVLQSHAAPTGTGLAVTGTVTDASNVGLAYKTVVLTGSDGVYFAADINGTDMAKTFTAVTDNTGAILATSAYAFFTKSGVATVTATSGTATDTNSVTVADSVDPYKIVVDDIVGSPGSTLIVTGKVTDMFGNGVPANYVDLSTGTSTVGSITTARPQTNSNGVFSSSFITGSNKSGVVTLTGTLETHANTPMTSTTVLAPVAAWKSVAGLTFDAGDYQSDGQVTIAVISLTLSAAAHVTAAGSGANAKLSGKFLPGTSVDIYGKESGDVSYSLVDSVTTDGQGDWGASVHIMKSTHFLAKAQGLSSTSHETVVYSKVSMTAKAMGHGKVKLSANGDPNVRAELAFYRSVSGKDPRLADGTSSSIGTATVTVKLPKGTRKLYAVYKAPGTNTGTSAIVSVKVK